jgi:NADPH:quinone reductase-like Zn-dependent oxidoreductase
MNTATIDKLSERADDTGVTTMRAIVQDRYGSVDVLELRDIAKPTIGENDVLIRVRTAAVNPADWAIMGGLPYIARPAPIYGLRTPRNAVRGTDVAGRVEAVGSAVTRFRPGDEVFGWCRGAFAEYAVASEDGLALKPSSLTFEQAAAVPTAGSVAIQALRDHGEVQAGQKVLVNGASGGIGIFAVQIAKSLGAEVTGVCGTSNVDMVRSIGADHVIDYTIADFTKNGERYDFLLDNISNRSLSDLRRALTTTGMLVPNGGQFQHRWFSSAGRLIKAMVSFRFVSQRLGRFVVAQRHDDLLALISLVEAGKVVPVIDRTYPLSKTAAAMEYVGTGHARGKVVISV